MKNGFKKRFGLACTFLFIAGLLNLSDASAQALSQNLNERDVQRIFQKANEAYQNQEYLMARTLYEEVLEEVPQSSAVYYNLGNVCYQLRQWGWSRYYYEKAKKISPTDPDVRANLRIILKKLPFSEDVVGKAWYVRLFLSILGWLTPFGWAVGGVVCLTALSIIFLIRLYSPTWSSFRSGCALLCGMALILSVLLSVVAHKVNVSGTRVIIVQSCEARYSPSLRGSLAFRIEEGLECQKIRQKDGWVFVRLDSEHAGWILKEFAGTI